MTAAFVEWNILVAELNPVQPSRRLLKISGKFLVTEAGPTVPAYRTQDFLLIASVGAPVLALDKLEH
jgi:hypothetical protein